MLRDTDIFVIRYTLEFLSRSRGGPKWPDDTLAGAVEEKAMLDDIDTALENSAFADTGLNLKPESTERTNFIIDRAVDYAVSKYGVRYKINKQKELGLIHALIDDEFANHQPISTQYPNGEPMGLKQPAFEEVAKLVNPGRETKYSKTRIYQRV